MKYSYRQIDLTNTWLHGSGISEIDLRHLSLYESGGLSFLPGFFVQYYRPPMAIEWSYSRSGQDTEIPTYLRRYYIYHSTLAVTVEQGQLMTRSCLCVADLT